MKNNKTKEIKRTIISIVIVFMFIILCSSIYVSAIDNNTSEAQRQSENITEATTESSVIKPKTTIYIDERNLVLYVSGKHKISPNITDGDGTTTYSTSNSQIATVAQDGTINALKKGTAKISVINNGVSAAVTVNVRNPELYKNKLSLSKCKSTTLKVIGREGKVTYKSSNTKVATVTTSGKIKAIKKGKATITVKTNGNIKLKCKITVPNASKWDLVKTKTTFKLLKNSVTANIGETTRNISDCIKADFETNVSKLWREGKITYNQCQKYWNKVYEDMDAVITIDDSSIGKLETKKIKLDYLNIWGIKITPKKKGTTYLRVRHNDNVLLIKYTVTHYDEFKLKGKTYKAVYNAQEAADVLIDEFYNKIAEGKKTKYESILCYYKTESCFKDVEKIFKKTDLKQYDKYHLYFIEYTSPFRIYFVKKYIPAEQKIYFTTDDTINNSVQCFVSSFDSEDKEKLTLRRQVYQEATKVLNDLNIDSYETDYDKLMALSKWFDDNCTYAIPEIYGGDAAIILEHCGVCKSYALATEYYCHILNIPCCIAASEYKDSSKNHAWNVVKIQGKWYHLDILWKQYFIGDENIKKVSSHTNYELNAYPGFDISKITIENEDYQKQ